MKRKRRTPSWKTNCIANPATPEEIWAILRSVSEKQEKSAEEAEKRQQEADRRQKEIDRQLEETRRQMQDTDRRLKKTDELFTSQWGKLMESLVEGDLVVLLQARGIEVESTHSRVGGRRNGEHYEFDILAINGEEVVVVEVKTTLRSEDVTHFVEKLARFTEYEPVWKGKNISRCGGLPEDGCIRAGVCGAAGFVRHPGHRQQRRHHQPDRFPAQGVPLTGNSAHIGRCSLRLLPECNVA